jgi:uncharacterized protein
MLVEFSVTNFRSFGTRQTLSLVASTGKELRQTHVIDPSAPATPDLVRSAVIYGPNAAGKSNLILALNFMRDFVVGSANQWKMGDSIPIAPFTLDAGMADKPSEFEIIFVVNNIRYQYGFEIIHNRVESEWLFAYPEGRPQRWFRRKANTRDWEFGPSFRGQRKVWQDATRDNALFLSTAVQLNAEQLEPVFDWFHNRLRLISSDIDPSFSIHQSATDETWRQCIAKFLSAADLSINDIQVKPHQFEIPENLPTGLRRQILRDTKDVDLHEIRFSHHTESGDEVFLDLEQESRGTQKLFTLAGPWIDVLMQGWVLFVDELDTSLHPQIMRYLIGLFHNPEINTKGAQLVFSTHDTSILDRSVFRRDQIWFVEKDSHLQSQLYPLTDFSPRKGENLEHGYLRGRYGALPFIEELRL